MVATDDTKKKSHTNETRGSWISIPHQSKLNRRRPGIHNPPLPDTVKVESAASGLDFRSYDFFDRVIFSLT